MNRHALSFGCLDYFMKLSTVTSPDSEAVTRISCGSMMNLQMSAAGLSQRGCGNKVGGRFRRNGNELLQI